MPEGPKPRGSSGDPCLCGATYRRKKHEERVGFLTDPKWIHPGGPNHNPCGLYRHLHHHRGPFHAYVRTKCEGLAIAFGTTPRSVQRWFRDLEGWGLVETHPLRRALCVHFTNAGDFDGFVWASPKILLCPDRVVTPQESSGVTLSVPNGNCGVTDSVLGVPKTVLKVSPHMVLKSPEHHTRQTNTDGHDPCFPIDSKETPYNLPIEDRAASRTARRTSERQKRISPILLEFPSLSKPSQATAMAAMHRWAKGAGSWAGPKALASAFRVVCAAFVGAEKGRYEIKNFHAYAGRLLDHYCQAYNAEATRAQHEALRLELARERAGKPRVNTFDRISGYLATGMTWDMASEAAARDEARYEAAEALTQADRSAR